MTSNPFLEQQLTAVDKDLLKTMRTLCRLEAKTRFSSDDFRRWGLDRFLKNTKHGVGGVFARWQHQKIIRKVGRVRSRMRQNRQRTIFLYEFTPCDDGKPASPPSPNLQLRTLAPCENGVVSPTQT